MRAFANTNPRDLTHAVTLLQETRKQGRRASLAGGGSDLLGMMKERLVTPDVLVNLKAIRGLDQVTAGADAPLAHGFSPATGTNAAAPVRQRSSTATGTDAAVAQGFSPAVRIGGFITLDALGRHPLIRDRYTVLAEAAESVGTPQIRNVATLAGNICQRPWCWYFRNGFPCLKNGGKICYAATGENQFHAIFAGGPSHIVHPSDAAPALVALDARFRIVGPSGERVVPAADFFTLPRRDPARENVLAADDVLAEVLLPPVDATTRSTYHKVLDREAWTHAVVSAAMVLEMARDVCRRARIVLGGVAPVPWRLPNVERLLAGQRITAELAARAGEVAVDGARPLEKNGYKVPLTSAVVRRTLLALAARA